MSYRNSSLQQDILLKHYVDEPEGARPGFNWGEALDEEGEPLGNPELNEDVPNPCEEPIGGVPAYFLSLSLKKVFK